MANLYAVTYTNLTTDGMGPVQAQIFVLAADFDEAVTKFRLKGGMDSMTLTGVNLFAPAEAVLQ